MNKSILHLYLIATLSFVNCTYCVLCKFAAESVDSIVVCDAQVQLWKNYIQWEKSNPLRSEDTTLITKRGTSWRLQHYDSCDSDFWFSTFCSDEEGYWLSWSSVAGE